MRYKDRFDKERRDMLKVMLGAGITPALLRASSLIGGLVASRVVEAQASSRPTKSLLILQTGGAHDNLWRPTGSPGNLTMGRMSMPYQPISGLVAFVAGANLTAGAHGHMFHRFNDGSFSQDSFDVNIGRTIGEKRPLQYLNLGVETKTDVLSRQGGSGIPTIDDPKTAFKRMFGGGAIGGGTGGGTSGAPDPRKAIVDVHREAIMALKGKLGQHELLKMDSHLTTINELGKKLEQEAMAPVGPPPPPPSGACAMPAEPTPAAASFDAIAKTQIEIAVLALECDLTASVSLAFGNDQHSFEVPGYGESHRSHHCCPGVDDYVTTVNYIQGLVVKTIQALQAKGLLSSTIVTQVTDFGDAQQHLGAMVPLSVTGAGVKKGVVVNASGKNQADLFQAVAEIMGATSHPNYRTWSTSPVTGLAG